MSYAPPIGGVTCATCVYFRPSPSNPAAAMGRCLADARHGYFFAGEVHRCMDHEAIVEGESDASIEA